MEPGGGGSFDELEAVAAKQLGINVPVPVLKQMCAGYRPSCCHKLLNPLLALWPCHGSLLNAMHSANAVCNSGFPEHSGTYQVMECFETVMCACRVKWKLNGTF